MPETLVMTDAALSVAANAVSANIYAGKLGEWVERPSIVRVRAAAAAVGLLFTILAAGVVKVQDQEFSNANRWPLLPDDLLVEFPFRGGRLFATVRNRTAGAVTFNQVTEIIAVA